MQSYLNNIGELTKLDGLQTAVALGQFDAMHLGHIEIIKKAVGFARENKIKSLVYMFSNNPIEVITGKKIPSVNSLEKRISILESLGVDIVVAQEFDSGIMNMTCEDFGNEYLKELFGAKFVAAGYNYSFGRGGSGDINVLKMLCADRNIKVCAVSEVKVGGNQVSSTIIRNCITDGDVSGAAQLMGRYHSVSGTVIRGNGIGGSVLGFPTANIALPTECVLPKFGVYISRTHLDGEVYNSITNIGGKPTVDDESRLIETYIDGKFNELYGENIEVELCEYIRGIMKFENKEALMAQLEKDKLKMKGYFKTEE